VQKGRGEKANFSRLLSRRPVNPRAATVPVVQTAFPAIPRVLGAIL